MILSFPAAFDGLSLALDNGSGAWVVVDWACGAKADASAHERLEFKIQSDAFPSDALAFVSGLLPPSWFPLGTRILLEAGGCSDDGGSQFTIRWGLRHDDAFGTHHGGQDGEDPSDFEAMIRSVAVVAGALHEEGLPLSEPDGGGGVGSVWIDRLFFDSGGTEWTFSVGAESGVPEDAGELLAAKAALIFSVLSGTSDLRGLRFSDSEVFPLPTKGGDISARGAARETGEKALDRLSSRIGGKPSRRRGGWFSSLLSKTFRRERKAAAGEAEEIVRRTHEKQVWIVRRCLDAMLAIAEARGLWEDGSLDKAFSLLLEERVAFVGPFKGEGA